MFGYFSQAGVIVVTVYSPFPSLSPPSSLSPPLFRNRALLRDLGCNYNIQATLEFCLPASHSWLSTSVCHHIQLNFLLSLASFELAMSTIVCPTRSFQLPPRVLLCGEWCLLPDCCSLPGSKLDLFACALEPQNEHFLFPSYPLSSPPLLTFKVD